MPISEETKRIVHGQIIPGMKTRWLKLKADKEAIIAQGTAITAQMASLKAQYDALIADIPEPTPEPTP